MGIGAVRSLAAGVAGAPEGWDRDAWMGLIAPDANAGPTGLYGMASHSLSGPWAPLNGSGLVLANPADDPRRAYSWFVSAEGIAASFVDDPGAHGFVGAPAPLLQLAFDSETVSLAGEVQAR